MVTIPGPPCSTLSRALDEPFAGSAATATTWLCVEQPGPWGRDALVESHLDHDVGAELATRAKGTGVRVVLIRRPGRHPDAIAPHRVYLAHTSPGRSFLRADTLRDPKHLLDLDFHALGAGTHHGFGAAVDDPLLLVCTNGRRDVCCAVRGRPLATEMFASHGDAVWECSHIGGHRFAPTALLLPTGYSYGDLSPERARAVLDGGAVVTDRCRGCSTWTPPGQAAELAVRTLTHTVDPDALSVRVPTRNEDGDWRVVVSHVDERSWVVTVAERHNAPDRPASCGAAASPSIAHIVERID
ncbi:MAG: sucrase ferredoxin [Actinomycetota bacterium]|nr:sucrase ferredoxin [Actinomycetota bacterium]